MSKVHEKSSQDTAKPLTEEMPSGEATAWETVDTGRFRPRRIRGSFRGRVLG